jgi:predicted glycoside hydrolase/deacetylase ChbG (UPF0249 family)
MPEPGPPLRIIINADDLGAGEEVNAAILDLMAQDRITSATILANGPAAKAALARVALFPQCSFGVHLNITEFVPLTKAPPLQPLLDERGALRKVIRTVPLTPALKQAVYEEWSAQVATVLAAGVPVSHLDSHHHSHTLPGFLPILRRLQKRFGIRRARVSINLFRPEERKSPLLGAKKFLFNAALRYFCGFRTPDACADFESFLHIPPATLGSMTCVELMTHPGHINYRNETRLLLQDWTHRFPCRLVTYKDL